jgi:hypothetical protein
MQLRTRFIVQKFDADIDEYRAAYGRKEGERRFSADHRPREVQIFDGNVALREGVLALFTLMTGAAETAYNAANARLGVGDSALGAVDTQTDLQGGNKTYMAQDGGYPILGALADKKVTFRSTFAAGDANYAWAEGVLDNGAVAGKTMFRKVQAMGTKAGGTWVLTAELSAA